MKQSYQQLLTQDQLNKENNTSIGINNKTEIEDPANGADLLKEIYGNVSYIDKDILSSFPDTHCKLPPKNVLIKEPNMPLPESYYLLKQSKKNNNCLIKRGLSSKHGNNKINFFKLSKSPHNNFNILLNNINNINHINNMNSLSTSNNSDNNSFIFKNAKMKKSSNSFMDINSQTMASNKLKKSNKRSSLCNNTIGSNYNTSYNSGFISNREKNNIITTSFKNYNTNLNSNNACNSNKNKTILALYNKKFNNIKILNNNSTTFNNNSSFINNLTSTNLASNSRAKKKIHLIPEHTNKETPFSIIPLKVNDDTPLITRKESLPGPKTELHQSNSIISKPENTKNSIINLNPQVNNLNTIKINHNLSKPYLSPNASTEKTNTLTAATTNTLRNKPHQQTRKESKKLYNIVNGLNSNEIDMNVNTENMKNMDDINNQNNLNNKIDVKMNINKCNIKYYLTGNQTDFISSTGSVKKITQEFLITSRDEEEIELSDDSSKPKKINKIKIKKDLLNSNTQLDEIMKQKIDKNNLYEINKMCFNHSSSICGGGSKNKKILINCNSDNEEIKNKKNKFNIRKVNIRNKDQDLYSVSKDIETNNSTEKKQELRTLYNFYPKNKRLFNNDNTIIDKKTSNTNLNYLNTLCVNRDLFNETTPSQKNSTIGFKHRSLSRNKGVNVNKDENFLTVIAKDKEKTKNKKITLVSQDYKNMFSSTGENDKKENQSLFMNNKKEEDDFLIKKSSSHVLDSNDFDAKRNISPIIKKQNTKLSVIKSSNNVNTSKDVYNSPTVNSFIKENDVEIKKQPSEAFKENLNSNSRNKILLNENLTIKDDMPIRNKFLSLNNIDTYESNKKQTPQKFLKITPAKSSFMKTSSNFYESDREGNNRFFNKSGFFNKTKTRMQEKELDSTLKRSSFSKNSNRLSERVKSTEFKLNTERSILINKNNNSMNVTQNLIDKLGNLSSSEMNKSHKITISNLHSNLPSNLSNNTENVESKILTKKSVHFNFPKNPNPKKHSYLSGNDLTDSQNKSKKQNNIKNIKKSQDAITRTSKPSKTTKGNIDEIKKIISSNTGINQKQKNSSNIIIVDEKASSNSLNNYEEDLKIVERQQRNIFKRRTKIREFTSIAKNLRIFINLNDKSNQNNTKNLLNDQSISSLNSSISQHYAEIFVDDMIKSITDAQYQEKKLNRNFSYEEIDFKSVQYKKNKHTFVKHFSKRNKKFIKCLENKKEKENAMIKQNIEKFKQENAKFCLVSKMKKNSFDSADYESYNKKNLEDFDEDMLELIYFNKKIDNDIKGNVKDRFFSQYFEISNNLKDNFFNSDEEKSNQFIMTGKRGNLNKKNLTAKINYKRKRSVFINIISNLKPVQILAKLKQKAIADSENCLFYEDLINNDLNYTTNLNQVNTIFSNTFYSNKPDFLYSIYNMKESRHGFSPCYMEFGNISRINSNQAGKMKKSLSRKNTEIYKKKETISGKKFNEELLLNPKDDKDNNILKYRTDKNCIVNNIVNDEIVEKSEIYDEANEEKEKEEDVQSSHGSNSKEGKEDSDENKESTKAQDNVDDDNISDEDLIKKIKDPNNKHRKKYGVKKLAKGNNKISSIRNGLQDSIINKQVEKGIKKIKEFKPPKQFVRKAHKSYSLFSKDNYLVTALQTKKLRYNYYDTLGDDIYKKIIFYINEGDNLKMSKILKYNNGYLNLNYTDSNGNSFLIFSVKNQNLEITQMLLEAGCNPNIGNKQKNYPLHYALALKNYSIANHLILFGADESKINKMGKDPWQCVGMNADEL